MNDDEQIDLLERARASTWPGPTGTGETVRRKSRHRGLAAGALTACSVAAAVAIVSVAVAGGNAGNETTPTATDPGASTVELAGVTLALPPAWEVVDSRSAGTACVGPKGTPGNGCPVLVAVSLTPDTAPVDGLDVVPELMSVCDQADPRLVEVVHGQLGSRSTSTFQGSCTSQSPLMTAWALDDRTVFLMARDSRWADDGARIFESLQVPSDWPEAPKAPPSDAPSPGDQAES